MKATGIRLKASCSNPDSPKLTEIDSIYVEGCTNPGLFKKEALYDYLQYICHLSLLMIYVFNCKFICSQVHRPTSVHKNNTSVHTAWNPVCTEVFRQLTLRRIWIVSVRIFSANLPIAPMDYEFRSLIT